MKRVLAQFWRLFAVGFSLSGMAYVVAAGLLWAIFGKFIAVFGLPRMYLYHAMYPVQYLFLASFAFAAVAAVWARWRGEVALRWWDAVVVLVLSLCVAGCLCGMLYVYHDMKAGYVPDDWGIRLLEGALAGPLVGGFTLLISVPYNIIETFVLYRVVVRAGLTGSCFGCGIPSWFSAVLQFAAAGGTLFAVLQFFDVIQGAVPCG